LLEAVQVTGWVLLGETFIVFLPMAAVMEAVLSRMPTLARNSECIFPLEFGVQYFVEEF
jgi:hypothetical protein